MIAREKAADYASCLLINAMAKHQLNMADEAKLDYNTVKGLLQEDMTLNRVRDSLLKRADGIFNE